MDRPTVKRRIASQVKGKAQGARTSGGSGAQRVDDELLEVRLLSEVTEPSALGDATEACELRAIAAGGTSPE